nr:NTP transferase domain-containing protein [Acidobacteriota bacterium]
VAVILAGGRGTRLGPYTAVFPKPLVPVGEYPIVEVLVRQLARAGFNELVFSVGHLAELIEAYFLNHPLRAKGVDIRFVREQVPMGTAGSLSLVEDLPPHFLALNGDVLTTLDFAALMQSHAGSSAALTIATHRKSVQLQLGVIQREDVRVTGYLEKPTYEHEVSMGVYAYSREALDYLPKNQRFDFPDLVLKLVAAGKTVQVYPTSDEWLDIGNPDDYATAQERVAQNAGKYLGTD